MTALPALLSLALFAAPAAEPPAPTEEEVEARLKAVQKQAADLQRRLDDLRKQEDDLRKQLAAAKGRPVGAIRAEVIGVLRFEAGRGYHVFTRSGGDNPVESRVWLPFANDKALLRKLEGLVGQEVIATGRLGHVPPGATSSIPPPGLYLETFNIEPAPNREAK